MNEEPRKTGRNWHGYFQSGKMPELQNHALDMRINVEGRRAQKTYERLVAVARELDRKT